ncbi:unnamed protein product [Ectocarpus sp. 12 AP-2014]
MGGSRVNPHSRETWRGVHTKLVEEPTRVQDHVGGALAVSFRELNENARTRFRKLGVLVRGVRAPVDMVAHLWEQVGVRYAGCRSVLLLFFPGLATRCLTRVKPLFLILHTGPERHHIIFKRPCGQVPCKGRGTELLLTRPGARLRERRAQEVERKYAARHVSPSAVPGRDIRARELCTGWRGVARVLLPHGTMAVIGRPLWRQAAGGEHVRGQPEGVGGERSDRKFGLHRLGCWEIVRTSGQILGG